MDLTRIADIVRTLKSELQYENDYFEQRIRKTQTEGDCLQLETDRILSEKYKDLIANPHLMQQYDYDGDVITNCIPLICQILTEYSRANVPALVTSVGVLQAQIKRTIKKYEFDDAWNEAVARSQQEPGT